MFGRVAGLPAGGSWPTTRVHQLGSVSTRTFSESFTSYSGGTGCLEAPTAGFVAMFPILQAYARNNSTKITP